MSIDLDVSLQKTVPPAFTFELFNRQLQSAFVTVSLHVPDRFARINLLMPLTAHKGLVSLAFQAHFEVIDTNFNVQLFGSDSHRERDGRIHLFQSLVPNVLVSLTSIAGVRLLF